MSLPRYPSPLRYPGGKAQIAPFLVEVMRINGYNRPHYIEPYAGGAGAALYLLFDEYVDTITINDADPRVQCCWEAVVYQNERFLRRLMEVRPSKTQWYKQRKIYERADLRSRFDLGFATFYLNRTSRSGIVRNAGPIGGVEQDGKYKIDARYNKVGLHDRIARIGRYRHRITVTGLDGLELLRRLDRAPKRAATTFVYLDPPYYNKGGDLYLNAFDHEQHARLAAFLCEPRKFGWVMTYDNVPAIRKLYAEASRIPFDLRYSAFERRDGKELVIYPSDLEVSSTARRTLRSVA